MKTLLIFVGAFGLCLCQVRAGDTKVYRAYKGQLYEVTRAKGWRKVYGKVSQVVSPDLLLLQGENWEMFAVRRCPYRLIDGDSFSDWVTQVDDFRYTTVLGAGKVVRCYDFGELAPGPGDPGFARYRRVGGQLYDATRSGLWVQKVGVVVEAVGGPLRWTNSEGRQIEVGTNDYVLDVIDGEGNHFAVMRCPQLRMYPQMSKEWSLRELLFPVGKFRWPGRKGWLDIKEMPCFDFGEGVSEAQAVRELSITNVVDEITERRHAEWVRQEAAAGRAWAQYEFGERLRDGRGVPADAAQARRWLKAAADQGHDQAKAALAKLLP